MNPAASRSSGRSQASSRWPTATVADVCEGVFDGPHATPAKTSSGPVFLGIWNIVNGRLDLSTTEHLSEADWPRWTRRVVPCEGDLVFSYETRLGTAALIPHGLRCCLGRRMALARPDRSKIDPRFFLFTFLGAEFQEVIRKHTTTGSTVDRIPLLEFPRFPVRLPPLPEQRAIASVLGTLDDRIETNRKAVRVLEGLARAAFTSWFVDFDPVRRAATGEPTGLPADVAALFPKQLVDSPIGPVPEGWRVVSIPDVFEVNPPRTLRKGEVAPYLDMSNMPTQGHAPTTWVRREVGSGMRFINGDTLVARITPCLENGKTAFVDFLADDEVAWGSTEYIVLRPRAPLPPVFAYLLARSEGFRTFAIQAMTGSSGRQRVPADSLAHFLIPIPPEDVSPLAELFGMTVEPLFRRMSVAMNHSRVLAALRDALLPRLISGELRIADAEKIIGRADV